MTRIISAEGSIDEDVLEDQVRTTMFMYDIPERHFDDLLNDVIEDYRESDISKLTAMDIVEVYNAGSYI